MTRRRIFAFISALISLWMVSLPVVAQEETQQRTVGVQYRPEVDSLKALLQSRPIHTFQGMAVSGDLLGLVMYGVANYGQLEGALRVNLKEKYFPVIELGLGHCDHADEESDLHFKTNSPYARIGADYNFARDLHSGNRILAGLRYGYTRISYDLSGPDLVDPVWGHHAVYRFEGQKSNVSWAEVVFGLEAKVWGCFHVGWSVRYRMRLSQKTPEVGQAWYVPGFGKNDTHNFGGTFNLVFDI